jgi:uncharacterized protein (TIGR02246 family)
VPARRAEDVHAEFSRAFAARDLDALVDLYEPDAVLVPQPMKVVRGRAAIREALAAFLAMDAKFEMRVERVLDAGDVALVLTTWRLSGTAPGGGPVDLSGRSRDVVRRRPDGRWLIAIDDPWG